jgi:hypothetical protein
MSSLPLDIQRRCERRWAARFSRPTVSIAPRSQQREAVEKLVDPRPDRRTRPAPAQAELAPGQERHEVIQEIGKVHGRITAPQGARQEEMTDGEPNEMYEVVPIKPGPRGPPKGWWTVKRNGIPIRHFPGKEKAQRYATDPEYRASLVTVKAWMKAKGKAKTK